MSEGVKLIEQERRRQIEVEDWSAGHDDANHDDGTLALAGACYALNAVVGEKAMKNNGHYEAWWPWDDRYWRPKDPIRDLVRAGALIAAEIDRLLREKEREAR